MSEPPTPAPLSTRPVLAPCTPERVAELVAMVELADTERHDTDQPEPAWDKTLAHWHQKLAALDPATAPQDRRLVDAVIRHLDCGMFDDELECAWRHYAYHAARRLYAPDDPRTFNATSSYADSLQICDLHLQALPLLHEVVTLRRRAGDIALLLLARAEYALALHATGCCHDAAREITSVWNLWRRDRTTDTDLGGPLLDATLTILRGCDRAADARHVLAYAPRAVTVNRVRIRSGGTGLINEAAEHAPVCTHTASTARTAVAS